MGKHDIRSSGNRWRHAKKSPSPATLPATVYVPLLAVVVVALVLTISWSQPGETAMASSSSTPTVRSTAGTAGAVGMASVTPRLTVPILMYHYVDEHPPMKGPYAAKLTISPEQFRAEMDYLAANGYHPVTLEQVDAAMSGGPALPDKPVAITFDDGGRDNYTVAFPILKSHLFVASFFVITGAIGKPQCMTWNQLRAMQTAGMAIESHTVHHPDLRTITSERLALELARSRETIAAELGRAPSCVAYPGGGYNRAVLAAVRAAGYESAVTTHPGVALDPVSRFSWPRVHVYPGETVESFAKDLEATGGS